MRYALLCASIVAKKIRNETNARTFWCWLTSTQAVRWDFLHIENALFRQCLRPLSAGRCSSAEFIRSAIVRADKSSHLNDNMVNRKLDFNFFDSCSCFVVMAAVNLPRIQRVLFPPVSVWSRNSTSFDFQCNFRLYHLRPTANPTHTHDRSAFGLCTRHLIWNSVQKMNKTPDARCRNFGFFFWKKRKWKLLKKKTN